MGFFSKILDKLGFDAGANKVEAMLQVRRCRRGGRTASGSGPARGRRGQA